MSKIALSSHVLERMKSLFFNPLFLDWAIPFILLLLLAPFSATIDLAFASYFHNSLDNTFSNHRFFAFFYRWGLLPGQIFGLVALFAFILSFLMKSFQRWRIPALKVGLTIGLGAGLITHAVLKDYWKRPRPKQVEHFGGTETFKSFYQPNFSAIGQFKSFPSGHAAMGFCFFVLAIQGRRTGNRGLLIGGLCLAISLGVCLSLTRIAQGGHFFSDTVTAACLMWITAATCDCLLERYAKNQKNG